MASIVPKGWKIMKMTHKPTETVEWDFGGKSFAVWFPSRRNPLENGNEFFSNSQGKVVARVKSDAKGSYHYCILLNDANQEDVVHGENSPPEMVIQ